MTSTFQRSFWYIKHLLNHIWVTEALKLPQKYPNIAVCLNHIFSFLYKRGLTCGAVYSLVNNSFHVLGLGMTINSFQILHGTLSMDWRHSQVSFYPVSVGSKLVKVYDWMHIREREITHRQRVILLNLDLPIYLRT